MPASGAILTLEQGAQGAAEACAVQRLVLPADQIGTGMNSVGIFSKRERHVNDCVRVLLFVTTRRRDLVPMERLADRLEAHGGYSVLLSGMSDFHFAVLDFKPNIVVIGKPDNAQGSWLKCISGCTVVSLNTEQGGLDEDFVLFNYLEGQRDHINTPLETGAEFELVDHHLIINDFTKQTLSPYIDPDTMHVVGYPRLLADECAQNVNPVSSRLTVGFACGVNIFDKDHVVETFECFWNRPYPPWRNIQTALADAFLECLWINHLVTQLKERYRVIVRYRPGDGSYLQDESNVEIDYSDSLDYLVSNVDIVIVGCSSIGVEALMVGVPAVSVAGLADPWDNYVGSTKYWVPQLVWTPNSIDELLELVDCRARGELDLCPDVERYLTEVRDTYYCGERSDRSIERIVDVIDKCERGAGARLDIPKLISLCDLSRLQRLLLRVPQSVSTRIPYRFVLWYTKVRRHIGSDPYLNHHVYIPE